MRIAYFDCFSGISGDMTLGAFLDAGLSMKALSSELAKLKIKGYKLKSSVVKRSGISGTGFECISGDNPHDRSLDDILSTIKNSSLNVRVKNTALHIFENMGAAEARVHGIKKGSSVRLHELGSTDSIVDVVGCAIAIDSLGIEEVYASAVTTGTGFARSAHGKLPVPAPAAIELLRGVPVKVGGSDHELVTPTGAAILKTLVKKFGEPPEVKVENIGYGAGSRDDKDGVPNMLRVMIGETSDVFSEDTVSVIETNIDDMNPQGFEYLFERLFKEGALDAYVTNIHMKKSRPGFKLTVLAQCRDKERLSSVIFNETTTIGLRFYKADRLKLKRKTVNVKTGSGNVSVKLSSSPGGIITASPEYDECVRLARKSGQPFKKIYEEAKAAVKR